MHVPFLLPSPLRPPSETSAQAQLESVLLSFDQYDEYMKRSSLIEASRDWQRVKREIYGDPERSWEGYSGRAGYESQTITINV